MTEILDRPQTTVIGDADQIPIYQASNGLVARAASSDLAAYVKTKITASSPIQQFATPTATGFSVAVASSTANTWLILTPLAGYAAGTIVLPSAPPDMLSVEVFSSQTVTALTLTGGTVIGTPTTIGAITPFRLRYSAVLAAWLRY